MKTYLVAGGGGFIGSHLCDRLLSQSAKVIIVDNFITGTKANVSHLVGQCEVIEADIREPWKNWLSESTARTLDGIYNLASPASPVDFARIPEFILTTAAEGHRNLLQLALWNWQNGQRKIPVLYASTSEVYGDPLVHPQPETYWGNVNPIGERSCYDEAKRFGEALSKSYCREHGLPIKIARIFNTYGPRMRPGDGRVICNFLAQALNNESLTVYGDGQQTRSFCYVDDLVRGLELLMNSAELGPMNIGNPAEFTILDVAKTIMSLLECSQQIQFLELPSDDPKRRKPDISLARKHLQWEPQVDLPTGLTHMLSDFRNRNINS